MKSPKEQIRFWAEESARHDVRAARLTEALKRLLEEHTDCASCDACQPAHDILHPDLLTERRQEFKAQLAKKP